ncbi:MAG: caspase family protein [Brucellaceae bacterium]|nr:caspase family protein [Brucellaceae bacterium]
MKTGRGGMTGGRYAPALSALLALVLVFFAVSPAPAADLRGVALIVGNGAYEALPELANPENDADAIEELLSDLGFDSVSRTDRDAGQLKRDLERFVEDAADADVAVLYYAGHGIEAGGENWLVPTDADLSALDDAAGRLVPLSDVLRRLREVVPVTILLLDACRDNPFPPGVSLKKTPDAEPVPVAAGGLAETRGAAKVTVEAAPEDNLGMVIGFAAEPGRPALDGDGGHSPYAAALLRHLAAMAGEEFGTVMRMVAEEVYLKTGGRQRPWVNESLRRLLYFGEAPAPVSGPEGDILAERRGLLLTIADLPVPRRANAEQIARSSDVPMSVVFAMMKAAGIDRDEDPATVEKRLRAEIDRFAASKKDQSALTSPDEELQRLTALADEAELEGALRAANGLRDEAKARVAALRSTREEQIAALRERIAEDADIYARSAETKTLLFQHREAAADFGEAHDIIAEWDREKAARYRIEQVGAYLVDGELNGAVASLDAAERLARDALSAAAPGDAATARLRRDLAVALMLRGARANDTAAIEEARDLLETALAQAATLPPRDHARLGIEAGRAVGSLAVLRNDRDGLLAAGDHFRAAATRAAGVSDAALEAEARFRLVQALYYAWSLEPDQELWAAFYAEMTAFVAMIGAEADVDALSLRYIAQTTGIALDLALRRNTTDALRTASEINGLVAGMFDAEKFPLIWASLQVVEGRIGLEWSDRFGDPSQLENALEAQRAALATFREAGSVNAALEAEWNAALTLAALGFRMQRTDYLEQAEAALAALAASDLVRNDPARVRGVAFHGARVGAGLAAFTGDAARIEAPVATLRKMLDGLDDTVEPAFRAQLQAELGKAVFWQTQMAGGNAEGFRSSAGLLAEAVAFFRRAGADAANVAPFTELAKYYADAEANLALTTGELADLKRAVAANREIYARLVDIGQHDVAAITANTVAFLIAQTVRLDFDADLLAVGEEMAGLALAAADRMPVLAGYFENTACELKTERARNARDADLAREALDQCRAALEKLKEFDRQDAIPTSQAAVRRAEALVAELGG